MLLLRNVFIILYDWVYKIPWRRKMATYSSILAWKISWTEKDWWATVHWVTKSKTRLSD